MLRDRGQVQPLRAVGFFYNIGLSLLSACEAYFILPTHPTPTPRILGRTLIIKGLEKKNQVHLLI